MSGGDGGLPGGRVMRWLPWIFGVAVVGVVIYAGLHFSEARDFVHLAERANGWWLLAALGLQALTYLAQGQVVGCVGRAGRFPLSLRTLTELSVAKLFVEQAVPSAGLSGNLALVGFLEGRGMPRRLISTVVIIDLVSCYAAYVLGLAVALALAFARGATSPIIIGSSAAFIALAVVLSAIALTLAGRTPGRLARGLVRIRPIAKLIHFLEHADARLGRSPRLIAKAVGYQLGILLLDTATVWALVHAVGAHAAPSGVFVSFMISTVFRLVGISPGGLGTFEASSVFTLRLAGVSTAAALSATLLFRGLSFWLPMAPGLRFYRRLMKAKVPPPEPPRYGGGSAPSSSTPRSSGTCASTSSASAPVSG